MTMVAYNEKMLSTSAVGRRPKEVVTGEKSDPGINIAIPRAIHGEFSRLCARRRTDLKPAVAAVLGWVLRSDPPVQSAMLDIKDGMQAAYADALEAIAKKLREQADLVNRVEHDGTIPPDPPTERNDGEGEAGKRATGSRGEGRRGDRR